MRIWTIYDLMETNDDADACVVNGQSLKGQIQLRCFTEARVSRSLLLMPAEIIYYKFSYAISI